MAISSLVMPETFDASVIDSSCSRDRYSSIVFVFWGGVDDINLFSVSVVMAVINGMLFFCLFFVNVVLYPSQK